MLRDLVNRDLASVKLGTNLSHVSKLMAEKNVGSVLVLDGGKPKGIITDRDIVTRCIGKGMSVDSCTVDDIMSESPVTCKETDGVQDCVRKMSDAKIRRIPVVDESNRVVGIVSCGDLLTLLAKEFSDLMAITTAQTAHSSGKARAEGFEQRKKIA